MRYTEEQKREILLFAEQNTITKACEHFNVSKYAINKWKGWKRKNVKESNQKWYKKNAADYRNNPLRRKAAKNASAKWRLENGTRDKTRNASYKRVHIFVLLAYYSNRNCQRKGMNNAYQLKPFDLWKLAKKQQMICPYTGLKLTRSTISVDHIIPLAKGGSNHPDNLALVDGWANKMKYDQDLETFQEKILAMADFIKQKGRAARSQF